MSAPFSLLLTRKSAEKYFGTRNPMGEILVFDGNEYQVTGVLENIPVNSHFHFDFLSPFSTFAGMRGKDHVDKWNNWSYHTYVRLREDADPEKMEPKLTDLLRRHDKNSTQTLELQPLKDIHFFTRSNFDLETGSDARIVHLFSAIAVFILLIACFNTMNLSTARAARRAREVGIRKVVGATRKSLVRQFLLESALFTLASFALSIALTRLLLPAFGSLINKPLDFRQIILGSTPLFLLVTALCVGLVSGLYPALLLSSFQPASILKGEHKRTARGAFFLRNILVTLQFVISIALIFCSLVVHQQNRFIRNKDLGLVTDTTLSVFCRADAESIRQEFESCPGVIDVTASSQIPINVTSAGLGDWEGKSEDEKQIVYRLDVDHHFLDFFSIKMASGRNFSKDMETDGNAFILNEAAVKAIGWQDPIGRMFGWNGNDLGPVIGVVRDFHFLPLHLEIEPLAIFMNSREKSIGYLLRLNAENIPETIPRVKSIWKKFHPDRVFRYTFLDERLDRLYGGERKLGAIFSCFTLLAVLIAGLGLIGIASITAEQKTKEIGIRKVLGASVPGISLLLTRNFLRVVLLANLLGWPAGWFIMSRWLQNFAYRTSIGPLVFAASALLAAGAALVTVGWQTIRAAVADPVKSLRYE